MKTLFERTFFSLKASRRIASLLSKLKTHFKSENFCFSFQTFNQLLLLRKILRAADLHQSVKPRGFAEKFESLVKWTSDFGNQSITSLKQLRNDNVTADY